VISRYEASLALKDNFRDTNEGVMKMQVLLVEDNEALAGLFRVLLRRLGSNELSVATTKKGALEAFETGTFDVIFIDMGLEGLPDRGLEIIREIRVQSPEQRIGVLSSNDLQDMVRQSRQVGAAFYMVKPFTIEGLKLVLEGDSAAIKAYQPDIGEGRIIAL
jgi:two-component system response regulator DevR